MKPTGPGSCVNFPGKKLPAQAEILQFESDPTRGCVSVFVCCCWQKPITNSLLVQRARQVSSVRRFCACQLYIGSYYNKSFRNAIRSLGAAHRFLGNAVRLKVQAMALDLSAANCF